MIKAQKRSPILSFASGKGGVGKTLTTVHVAVSAQRMGFRSLVLDGDLGMANIDVVLGLRPRHSMQDVLVGMVDLEETIMEGPSGMHIIPSGSGVANLADLGFAERVRILESLESISSRYDLIFIDTGAGISSNVLHLNSVSDAIYVVTTPEPHALTDAYAFIKVMHEKYGSRTFYLVVNQVVSEHQGLKVFHKLAEVSLRYLSLDLKLGGVVPKDQLVERSVMLQRAGDIAVSHTRSGQVWNEMARTLCDSIGRASSSLTGRGLGEAFFL